MSRNRYVLSVGIASALLGVCHPTRANEADDEIQRLVVQAQEQASAHAAGDMARTIDEASKLVSRASPDGVAAMAKLMEHLDSMMLDAQHEAANAAAPSERPATPSLSPPQARPLPASASAGLLDLLRRRGDTAFLVGDISAARRYYQRGAEAGSSVCAEALARTYDAKELRRMGAIGAEADPALAATWRDRARQLGQSNAP